MLGLALIPDRLFSVGTGVIQAPERIRSGTGNKVKGPKKRLSPALASFLAKVCDWRSGFAPPGSVAVALAAPEGSRAERWSGLP